MRYAAALVAVALPLLAGCAAAPVASSPEQTAFLESIASEPTEFEMSREESNDGWGRAQTFLAKYSTMKIQNVSDSVVETFNPTPDAFNPGYGYRITRAIQSGKSHYTVECFNGNAYTPGKLVALPARNARILARYIRTGDLPHPELVAR